MAIAARWFKQYHGVAVQSPSGGPHLPQTCDMQVASLSLHISAVAEWSTAFGQILLKCFVLLQVQDQDPRSCSIWQQAEFKAHKQQSDTSVIAQSQYRPTHYQNQTIASPVCNTSWLPPLAAGFPQLHFSAQHARLRIAVMWVNAVLLTTYRPPCSPEPWRR
jgi:hypothetical protein